MMNRLSDANKLTVVVVADSLILLQNDRNQWILDQYLVMAAVVAADNIVEDLDIRHCSDCWMQIVNSLLQLLLVVEKYLLRALPRNSIQISAKKTKE